MLLTCNSLLLDFLQEELLVADVTVPSASALTSEKFVAVGDKSEPGDKVKQLFDQLSCHLPLVKVWFDWLSCQRQLWSNSHQEIKDEIMYVSVHVCVWLVCVDLSTCTSLLVMYMILTLCSENHHIN